MKPHRIIASLPQKATGEKLFTYDTETKGLNATEALIACVENINSGEQHSFYGDNAAEECREFLEANAPCIAWAHNGNSFDVFGLVSKRELYEAKKIASGTKVFEYEINGVKYRDTRHLIPLKLSQVARSVDMEKGETPQEYIDGTVTTITQEAIDYCLLDVKILAAAIRRLHQLYADLVGVDKSTIQLPLTTASIAYRVWCIPGSWPEHWIWRDARKRWRPIARCRGGFNEIYRKCEHGGRVQVMCEPAEMLENIVSYDANSLYPSVMYDEAFPDPLSVGRVGPTFEALRYEINRTDRVCVADVRMVAPEGVPLFLPNTDSEGRKKWDSPNFDGWLCEPELRLALEVGWIVEEVREIVSARVIRPFRHYVRKLYDLRMGMQNNGDPASSLCKLLLNALYGRFGIKERPGRVEGEDAIYEAQQKKEYDTRYELRFYDGLGLEWPYLIDYGQMRKAPASQWFGFSSFILSYGRERLARAIIAAGENVAYCDTDSVHFAAKDAEAFEKQIAIGGDLSEWKLETPEPIPFAKYWEPKAYTHFNEDGSRLLVKHKGVRVRDDKGNYLKNAGDLTKEQEHRIVVSLYEGLRRGLEPGTPLLTRKRSRRFFTDGSDE